MLHVRKFAIAYLFARNSCHTLRVTNTENTLFNETREILQFNDGPLCGTFSTAIFMSDVCAPSATYGPQRLQHLTLFHTRSGVAQAWTIKDEARCEYSHQAGTLAWMAPGISLEERVEASSAWMVDYIFLAGSWADSIAAHLLSHHNGALFLPHASPSLLRTFTAFFDAGWNQENNWQWNFVASGATLLGAVIENTKQKPETLSLQSHIKSILDASPDAAPSVPEIARTLHLTPRQLDYRFQQECGIPVARWIREYRIQRAVHPLRQGRSVTQVSQELGFANPYHFSRVFKTVMGVAPSRLEKDVIRGLHFTLQ
jgi:AraC-like DNA-binding protein